MRALVVSDIHANLVALEAVLAAAGSFDVLWHLGDVVGYGPDPNAVIDRLRDLGAIGVRGNHDAAALGGPEIDAFNPYARSAMEWTRVALSGASRTWLDTLPERRTEAGFGLVHGSPRDPIWEYITSAPVARANLASMDTTWSLFGHTHQPIAFRDDNDRIEALVPLDGSTLRVDARRALLNPGSVGQPRDGNPAASYATVDTETGEVRWSRVAYDVSTVQRAMRRLRLPEPLAARLAVGL